MHILVQWTPLSKFYIDIFIKDGGLTWKDQDKVKTIMDYGLRITRKEETIMDCQTGQVKVDIYKYYSITII